MGEELRRNFLGFVLLICGVGLVLLGARVGIARLSDAGFSFIGMGGLALQVRPEDPERQKKDQAQNELRL